MLMNDYGYSLQKIHSSIYEVLGTRPEKEEIGYLPLSTKSLGSLVPRLLREPGDEANRVPARCHSKLDDFKSSGF